LDYAAKAWLPAREIIVKAMSERMNVDKSGKIVVFDEFAPWKVRLLSSFSPFSQATHLPLSIVSL
jgi:uncharacterized UPF0160 family protein